MGAVPNVFAPFKAYPDFITKSAEIEGITDRGIGIERCLVRYFAGRISVAMAKKKPHGSLFGFLDDFVV